MIKAFSDKRIDGRERPGTMLSCRRPDAASDLNDAGEDRPDVS